MEINNSIHIIDPREKSSAVFTFSDQQLVNKNGHALAPEKGVYKFVEDDNYTANFGYQWNKFEKTQIDRHHQSVNQSKERLFAVTNWPEGGLEGENILEVGSGAGRFTRVVLEHTQANLYSVDYSNAVEANYRNNKEFGDRLRLFQASIYELPFAPNQFDKVFCFGVLQHTPDFKKSVECLCQLVKPGGELIVDFYPIRGWWTKIHAKYLLRPFTKKMNHEKLLRLIEKNADWLITIYQILNKIGLHILTRFLPICDIKNTLPQGLTSSELKEWVILDTFDMFSPAHDQPQKLATVVKWFNDLGMKDTKSKVVEFKNNKIHIVSGRK